MDTEKPELKWQARTSSEPLVVIDPTGNVHLPKGRESLTEVSREFWDMVQMHGRNQTARLETMYRLLRDAQSHVQDPALSAAIADALASEP